MKVLDKLCIQAKNATHAVVVSPATCLSVSLQIQSWHCCLKIMFVCLFFLLFAPHVTVRCLSLEITPCLQVTALSPRFEKYKKEKTTTTEIFVVKFGGGHFLNCVALCFAFLSPKGGL